ncbi:hypothetical protein MRB53_001923 [Persea americana]|uniref:Uncharacterized protein n=1 Tax=Persea americana TaxID=3435 RepID=A0ACC2MTC2_PERAE|nr:hypothetical protein MRB53_001923 [Persea americana]
MDDIDPSHDPDLDLQLWLPIHSQSPIASKVVGGQVIASTTWRFYHMMLTESAGAHYSGVRSRGSSRSSSSASATLMSSALSSCSISLPLHRIFDIPNSNAVCHSDFSNQAEG